MFAVLATGCGGVRLATSRTRRHALDMILQHPRSCDLTDADRTIVQNSGTLGPESHRELTGHDLEIDAERLQAPDLAGRVPERM